MRPALVLLIFIIGLIPIWLIPSPAWGMDVLIGTVVSVDPESGDAVVRLFGEDDEEGREIHVAGTQKPMPGFIRPGTVVRMWGNYPQGPASSRFDARHITRGSERMPGRDPTGVRGRIRQGGRPPMGRPPGPGRGPMGR